MVSNLFVCQVLFKNFPKIRNVALNPKYIHSHSRLTQRSQFKAPLSAAETDNIAENLRRIVGNENVSLSDSIKRQHGQDEGAEHGIPPDVVVFAEGTELVSEVMNVKLKFAILLRLQIFIDPFTSS